MMERRGYDRLMRPGRRESDRRVPTAEHRRVLLVGQDEAWRLLTAYLFEEAGYVVYAAADGMQAVALSARLVPDVVLMQVGEPDPLECLARLTALPGDCDISVVVLTSSYRSDDARRVRAAGGVTLVPNAVDLHSVIGEVDALMAARPRAQRALKRRLLDLQELARYCPDDGEGQASLRQLINQLQLALLAVNDRGDCIAASQGATTLTGYSRAQLLTGVVFEAVFRADGMSEGRWLGLLAAPRYTGTTMITDNAGRELTVHVAAVAGILPGIHLAAFAAAGGIA